jgi:F420-dependent oxidoreductase-like protein
MRIGIFISDTDRLRTTLDDLIGNAIWAEEHGFDTAWAPHLVTSLDALVGLAVAARSTTRIELATAVVPTYPVHPLALARAAATTQAAAGGRFTLGIGPSHPIVIQEMLGLDYERPAAHTREVLEILRRACGGEPVVHAGDRYRIDMPYYDVPGNQPISLLVAALAPMMLKLAGEIADGTIAYWADEHALATHVVPSIVDAAAAAGRPPPRVVAGIPVAVAADPARARELAAQSLAMYEQIPTYQRILAHGRSATCVDVAVIGTEAEVLDRLAAYAQSGATDLALSPMALGESVEEATSSRERTCEHLASMRPDLSAAGVAAATP